MSGEKLEDWQQEVDLSREILFSPPGNWTHDLVGEPVRFVKRAVNPAGIERVYFRAKEYSGSWTVAEWERHARPRDPEPEQMTLF
ncbi:hypothetical protein NSS79_20675 [Paenibacillus sp. FSL L8-0436]|uniref:hypothetical protein n=1 Tax=Paenibacillus sp. FSL L8-0436 TaxID=2954686 RepID=UPI0031593AE3